MTVLQEFIGHSTKRYENSALERAQDAIESKKVIRTHYVPLHTLDERSPGEVSFVEVTSDATLGINEEDGLILIYCKMARKDGGDNALIAMDMGREITDEEATRRENFDPNVSFMRYIPFDVRLVEVVETDGPAERADLRASFEQRMKKERDGKASEGGLTQALSDLTNFLRTGSGAPVDPMQTLQAAAAAGELNISQLEEMVLQLKEQPEKRGPGRPRKTD